MCSSTAIAIPQSVPESTDADIYMVVMRQAVVFSTSGGTVLLIDASRGSTKSRGLGSLLQRRVT